MPNVAAVLKAEIARISRKEAKAAVSPIRKPSVRLRKDVAQLKKRMASMEKANREIQALLKKMVTAQPAAAPLAEQKVRITAKGMRSLRRKLGLSQVAFAALLGVSTQIVQYWEKRQGAIRVRDTTRAAIMAARGIGAREARKRLEEMKAAKKATKVKQVKKAAGKRRK